MISKTILRIKQIKPNTDFNLYHNEYKINYEAWHKLTLKDRVKILNELIESDNNIINDYAKTNYNILPYDLKEQLNKIVIEVY